MLRTKYVCPVCGYAALERPAADFTICPSCGTEFELDDEIKTHAELRKLWLESGAKWFSESIKPPAGWREYRIEQLVRFTLNTDDGVNDAPRTARADVRSVQLIPV